MKDSEGVNRADTLTPPCPETVGMGAVGDTLGLGEGEITPVEETYPEGSEVCEGEGQEEIVGSDEEETDALCDIEVVPMRLLGVKSGDTVACKGVKVG